MGEDRKKAVLQAGAQLFAEKGYFATTVQDLAEQCNMSKASIYKMFTSKEDILLQIFNLLNEEIVEASSSLHFEDNVPPRDQLVEKLNVQLQTFIKKHDFYVSLHQNMPLELGNQIRQKMLDFKRIMMNWQKEALLLAFGVRIEPIVWDMAVCMQGITREFLSLLHLDRKRLSVDMIYSLSQFIVDNMEAMIDKRTGKEPVLDEQAVAWLESYNPKASRKYFGESEWRKSLRELMQSIHQRSPDTIKMDLIGAVEHLDIERRKKLPQAFMMDALIFYLDQRSELREEVAYVKHVYFANWEEEKHD